MKRIKTKYPGVFYREAERIGGAGLEKVFYVVFKRDGRTIEEKVGRQYTDDMTAARAARIRGEFIEGKRLTRKEAREQEQQKKETEANRPTLSRLWTLYLDQRPDLKGIVTDKNRFENHLKPVFGDKTPDEIAALDVDRLRLKLLKKRSPATVRNVLELLRRIINFGVEKNLCQPLSFRIKLSQVNNERTEDLNPDQLKSLLEAIEEDQDEQIKGLMLLALYTGMRRGELFRLKWEHIDFERGFIRLVDPKGGRDQTIPMNEAARMILESHPRLSEYIFPGRGGGQRVDAKKGLHRIRKRAGLPDDFRPLHGLRHAYASMLASSGQVDLYTLQRLLTHKSPVMTQRYAHLRDEALRKAADVASELINGATAGKNKRVVEMKRQENKS